MRTMMRPDVIRLTGLALVVMFFGRSAAAQPSRKFDVSAPSERRGITEHLAQQIAQEQIAGTEAGGGDDPTGKLLELSPALTAGDFSPESRRLLELAFQYEPTKDNMLLAGMADADALNREIETWAGKRIEQPASGMFYGTLPWAANLVRARRGDEESLQKVLDASRKADIESQVVFLLKELAYVPQPEVAAYIAAFVFSEERLEPLKPTVRGLLHAQYAAAALSRMLEGSPVPYREDYSYSPGEILALRGWLETINGNWQFRNGDRSR